MSCGRQAGAANREEHGGRESVGATLSVRRVEYDVEREIKALGQSGLPRADWIAKTLLAAAQQMP
jgi:hypothetical protein